MFWMKAKTEIQPASQLSGDNASKISEPSCFLQRLAERLSKTVRPSKFKVNCCGSGYHSQFVRFPLTALAALAAQLSAS